MNFTIGQLSSALGVSPETIRHYREVGLLRPEARENGYFSYDVNDALQILLVREFRSQEKALPSIKETLEAGSMAGYCHDLARREERLQENIAHLELSLARLRETRVYASCGVRILNRVEEFDGPATWAVPALDSNGLDQNSRLNAWVTRFPFTYVSATIALEQLNSHTGDEPYHIFVGAGALEKYVHHFRLPLSDQAFFQPGGHFIRTCVPVRDVLSISPKELAPLLEYARKHHYRFASCTGGRLLFVEQAASAPLYYMLIWVRVDPA